VREALEALGLLLPVELGRMDARELLAALARQGLATAGEGGAAPMPRDAPNPLAIRLADVASWIAGAKALLAAPASAWMAHITAA
jgi:hypothetical protein